MDLNTILLEAKEEEIYILKRRYTRMSRKHHKHEQPSYDECGLGSRKPTLPMLIILILILLQFGGGNYPGPSGGNQLAGFGGIDNGILFIIALFYLSCCNTCKSGF